MNFSFIPLLKLRTFRHKNKTGYPSNLGNIDDKKDVSILNFTTTLEK